MVTITFPDRETEKRALPALLGRFSGHFLHTASTWCLRPRLKH
jgi:hypothetical protein